MIIEVLHKREYGNDRYYPISTDANMVIALMGRSTFVPFEIDTMRGAGWIVKIREYKDPKRKRRLIVFQEEAKSIRTYPLCVEVP